nr:hypothetical protein [Tanacetum cinerariifolium]
MDVKAKEIHTLKARIKKLEKRCNPSILHHQAWLRSVSLLSKKKKLSKKKSVSKQGRKYAKSGPTKDGSDKLDDELDEDMKYIDTEEALNEGRKSTVGTARSDDDTARPDVSTTRLDEKLSTAGLTITPTTSTIFDDEEMTLADTLIKLKDDKAKEVERERYREEQASMDYIEKLYDEVQARIDDDHELAVRWTHEEKEKYIVDERAKLFAEYFKRRKKQLVEEKATTIRNKPPTKTQLRRLMMTYLTNMHMFTHNFVPIGSEKDERMIRNMNKKAEEESSDKDPDEEGVIDYEVLDKIFPILNRESKFYHYDRHGAEGIYYRIFTSDGSSRLIKTFSEMVTRFDRLYLVELYNLIMQRFESTTPEVLDLILWGDLRTMFEANTEDELWQNQEKWSLKS